MITREQFDNYKFSIKTEVRYRGQWDKITEVNFEERLIRLKNGKLLDNSELDAIRE